MIKLTMANQNQGEWKISEIGHLTVLSNVEKFLQYNKNVILRVKKYWKIFHEKEHLIHT